ncbi:unnamed protein product [Microthlaspi erraticum]|uniref:Glycosyltransferase n=1 Tax=Microthlaspi erraticum TaxID=1685480 RepID=A0A6D2ISW2_9BRAS|nr:unnamed protein product [Microthlaspi erraticum]
MKVTQKCKIIFIPYPAQGHVTPMLHLASAFVSRGFSPVVMTPESIHRRISTTNQDLGITFLALSYGQERPDAPPSDFFSIEKSMENIMPSQLEQLLLEEDFVACVVVDLLASWAIRVADRCGVPVAGFWPVMFASYRMIEAIPKLVRKGIVSPKGCPRQPEKPLLLPEQPLLSAGDLLWLIGTPAEQKGRFKFWQRTLERAKSLRWILVNSFKDEYEENEYNNKENNGRNPQIFYVGPLHNQASTSNITLTKNPSFWEEDRSCLGWLQEQKPNSVIYISFGSWVSPIGESKIKMLALALEASGRPFLWALNRVWQEGLPPGFVDRVTISKNQGRIVTWAPQIEVLKNGSVGCCVTHCGSNSTMEAVASSRRLVCYPVAGDQFLNCKYIVDVWKIGVRLSGFREEEVADGLRKVMEDQEMGERLKKLRERAMGNEARLCLNRNLTLFKDEIR